MDPFRETALALLVWRAFLTTLITVLTTILARLDLSVAFLAGANVALLFSLGMIAWSQSLTDERVVSTAAWRLLSPGERPAGIGGRRCACSLLLDEALLFAKAASAVAAALSVSAFVFAAE
jgi:hypothetical protein